MLRRIHSNSDNLVHGRLPCLRPLNSLILAQSDAVGGRPHQQPPRGVWIPGLRQEAHPGMTGQLNTPTIAPIRQVVRVPETIDFNPSELISSRLSGAMVPRPPIMMPRLPKLAKPHIA